MHIAIRNWADKIGDADGRRRKEGGGGERTIMLKFNNPHLAGGEKKS